jgi:hypothetical protein
MAMSSRFSKGSGAGANARGVKLDTRQMEIRLARLRRGMPGVLSSGVMEMNALIALRVAETSPRDTNRFVRGWLLACRDIGPLPVAVPPVTKSARREEYLKYLDKEFKRLSRERDTLKSMIDFWYTSKPNRNRNTRSYTEMTSRLRKIEKWIGKLAEQIKAARGSEDFLLFDKERGKRNYSSVRTNVHGGVGTMRYFEDRVLVQLRNLEAHTTIIERKYGIIGRALREAKAFGLTRVKARLVRAVDSLAA